jgi:hypothetical protein|tara:strand:+ start:193 stop:1281 length:1089 start_codon:yes stop_codon:yes gene_type:complete
MIDKLIIILIFILYTYNILDVILIKWQNNLFKSNYEECYIFKNISLYEIETYRYNLNKYIKNKEYVNRIEYFKFSYNIIIILSLILIIIIIIIAYKNEIERKNKIILIIIIVIILVLYYNIGKDIIKKNKEIEEDIKKNKSNILYKYDRIYKICNILMYLDNENNVLNEILEYKYTNIINNKRLVEQLELNIGKIRNISDEIKINYIKEESLEELDYLKYINFDEISPYFYKEYFDNMYIIYNNDKIYIKELKNNKKKEINNIIEEKLIDNNIEIEGKGFDYIEYFIENKNILFNMVDVEDEIKEKLDNNINIVILIIIYIILFIILSHYLLQIINSNIYIIILGIIIIIYILLIWIKLKIL